MGGAEGDLVPRDLDRGEKAYFDGLDGDRRRLDPRLREVHRDRGRGIGGIGVESDAADSHPHPDLFLGLARRGFERRLAEIDEAAREGPFTMRRIDAAAQQQEPLPFDHQASRDQLGSEEIDEAALRADFVAAPVGGDHDEAASRRRTARRSGCPRGGDAERDA